MVLAWLHTFFVLFEPGADKAGAIIEGRDESPTGFIFIEGQSKQPRLLFQCMFCCSTKLLRSFNNGGTMSFDIDVSKNLGKPFQFSNPVFLRVKKNMEASTPRHVETIMDASCTGSSRPSLEVSTVCSKKI
jgi:hypothetical protein